MLRARIAKQLIQIKEKFIVVNALKNGEIRIYENIGFTEYPAVIDRI